MSRSRSRRRRAAARGETWGAARALRDLPWDPARLACGYGAHSFNRGDVFKGVHYMVCAVCGATYQCQQWQWDVLPVRDEP
jgi:hypothetical protein